MRDETRVLYNAECPVCAAEINHYARYAADKALPLAFDDLNATALSQWGVSADQAAQRLHVLKNGEVFSGIPAFLALWADMPRYRFLARLVGLPGVRHIAVQVYDRVLAPWLYRKHLKRLARLETKC